MFWFILESRPCIYLFQFSFKTLHKFLKEKSFQTITWTDLTEFYRTPWKKQQKKSKLQIVVQGSLWCRSKEPIFEDRLVEVSVPVEYLHAVPQPGLLQPRLPQPGLLWIRSSNLVPLKKLQYSHNNSWKPFFGLFSELSCIFCAG